MNMTFVRDIIVIGGSSGSSTVLKGLLGSLPHDLPASIFITTHIASDHANGLAQLLAGTTALPVAQAMDGQPVESGHIYMAAPDRHLLLLDGTIRLGVGPRENMARPSIDPMFRSAALTYGPRVIGVVLSGMLSDGAAGLHAIKARGGTAVVQHPIDAEADQMPLAAMQAVNVDHVAPASDLAALLVTLAGTPAGAASPVTEELRLEIDIAAGAHSGSDTLARFARPSALTCPDCRGVLSEVIDARPLRYRCQIGHAYTAEELAAHIDDVDEAVRIAMRVMEERVTLVERMALDARQSGRASVAALYTERSREYRRYATTLREAALMSLRLGETPASNISE